MAKNLIIDRNIFKVSHWGTEERQHGILIASEEFPRAIRYVIRKNELMILGGGNGVFCLDLDVGKRFGGEVKEISEFYNRSEQTENMGKKIHPGQTELFGMIQVNKSKT